MALRFGLIGCGGIGRLCAGAIAGPAGHTLTARYSLGPDPRLGVPGKQWRAVQEVPLNRRPEPIPAARKSEAPKHQP